MKKLLILVLSLAMLFMVGCGDNANNAVENTNENATQEEVTEVAETTDVVEEEASELAGMGEGPILVTSFGQSADVAMLKALFTKVGVEITYDPVVTIETIGDAKTIVVAAGASTKGLGAAGIKPEEELERAQAIMDYAKENGITVIAAHLGGSARRGDLSDQFINIALSNAEGIVVVKEGDTDGFFTGVSEERSIPLALVETISSVVEPLELIFK